MEMRQMHLANRRETKADHCSSGRAPKCCSSGRAPKCCSSGRALKHCSRGRAPKCCSSGRAPQFIIQTQRAEIEAEAQRLRQKCAESTGDKLN
jgi:hypothetical protein